MKNTPYSVNPDTFQETFEAVMNATDERVTSLFAEMGIQINLDKPWVQDDEKDDEGYLVDEL